MEAKRESERPQWRASRVENSPQAEYAKRSLEQASETLNLRSYYSEERIDEIIEGATHLAVNHELKEEFFRDPRKCMFLMGIAEEWETTKNFRERRRLLDTLSLVSGTQREGKTLSMKVARLSAKRSPRGTEFDPSAGNTLRGYFEFIEREIEKDTDEEGTAYLEAQLADWSPKSILYHVRQKLKINRETERPVEFVQLLLGPEETQEKYGYAAFSIWLRGEDGTQTVVIVMNSKPTSGIIEHEYAHSQSKSIASGFGTLLDRALNEALTENATSSPEQYVFQRELLDQIKEDIPGFEDIAYRAYVTGKEKDLLKMDEMLIGTYGLRGRLAIARVFPTRPDYLMREVGSAAACMEDPTLTGNLLRQLKKIT